MKVDLSSARTAIVAEPLTAVALAFAAGACLALVEPRGRTRRVITSTLGAIALAALREAAGRGIAAEARSWIDARIRPAPGAAMGTATPPS